MTFDITKFKWVSYIGAGAFGQVHRYTTLQEEDGEITDVAVKKLSISAQALNVNNCREIQLIRNLKHRNIVHYIDHCTIEGQVALVMELCVGDLQKLIDSQRRLAVGDVAFLVDQVCLGLEYLHAQGIVHRDIKPANILVQCDVSIDVVADISQLVLKITDFGLAKMLNEDATSTTMTVVGTTLYMAPELSNADSRHLHYSMRSDVYSLGLVAYSLLRKDLHDLVPTGKEGRGAIILQKETGTLKSFLSACLQLQPSNRSTCSLLLQHPFFAVTAFKKLNYVNLDGICSALHYSKPGRIIAGLDNGRLITYDMRTRVFLVDHLFNVPILSIDSCHSFIAVASVHIEASVIILGSERHDVVDRKSVRQYKLSKDTCEETIQMSFEEKLRSISPDSSVENIYWVGTNRGLVKKINLSEKQVLNSFRAEGGKMVLQIKHLEEFILCLLKDTKSGVIGPVLAYNAVTLADPNMVPVELIGRDAITSLFEVISDKWLVYSNGKKLVSLRSKAIRKTMAKWRDANKT